MEVKDINKEIREKKVIVFDLDKTLAKSKSPVDDDIATILSELLEKYKISVITGGKLEQLIKQVVEHLEVSPDRFLNLYLQPTSGSALYTWQNNEWREIYNEKIPESERKMIISALNKAVQESGIEIPEEVYGERIEDRGSQITFSALGQNAPYEVKSDWDKDLEKRKKIQRILAPKIPEYEVAIGGVSSIDITKKGLNKGYGVWRLSRELGIEIKDMLFVGDRLESGGNDHSVIGTGIDWIDVENIEETKTLLSKF